jgi:transposase
VSRASISRILRAADLQPHRVQMWCHSKDPLYDAKLADITALYLSAPPCEPVLCIDEKSQIQALWRPHQRDPRPGRLARLQFDYVRRGTRCLFAAFNVRTGQVLGRMRPRRTSADFLGFLDEVALRYRQGVVHLVLDNLNTHYGPAVRAWNARHGRRFRFHYTPTHASWLNQIEIFFGILTRRVLRHARFACTRDLDRVLLGFLGFWNRAEAHPFRWTYREPALVA